MDLLPPLVAAVAGFALTAAAFRLKLGAPSGRHAAGAALAAAAAVALSPAPLEGALVGAVVAGALAALAAVDLRAMILPDALTLPLLAAGLAAGLAGLGAAPETRAVGAVAGWGALAGMSALWRRARGVDGIGLGDAKLAGAAGAWVGAWELATVMLVAAPAAAAVAAVRGGARPIPFGPFLALGVWLALTRCPCLAPA